jgi:hypothetical protein
MTDNKVIAQYLYDLAKQSKSEFIEVAQDSELIDIAKKLNLVIPSPDIAILKTVYAQTDVSNRNKIILTKSAVKKGLPTLIGKQANWSHLGKNHICGWILDAKLEEDLIIIYVAIFKSLFIEEFEKVQKMFRDGNLSVSFEIWNKSSETGESVLHDVKNGNRSIDPILFHGVGILIEDEQLPACPKAYAKKLLAMFNIDNLKEEIKDNKQEECFVYASQAIEETKCQNCKSCKCHKEEVMSKQKAEAAKIEEIKAEEIKVEIPAEEAKKVILCPECQEPLKDDETEICAVCKNKKIKAEDTKVEEPSVETKTEEKSEVAETKTEELKTEEKPTEAKVEEKPVEAKVEEKPAETPAETTPVEIPAKEVAEAVESVAKKVIAVINEEIVITHDSMDGKIARSGMRKTTRKFDDNTEEVFSEEFTIVDTYTQAQLDEKIGAAKAEKDAEIATIKAAHEVELKTKEKELASKSQEIAALTVKEETTKEKILEVGSVESKNKYLGIQEEVNVKAFGKK